MHIRPLFLETILALQHDHLLHAHILIGSKSMSTSIHPVRTLLSVALSSSDGSHCTVSSHAYARSGGRPLVICCWSRRTALLAGPRRLDCSQQKRWDHRAEKMGGQHEADVPPTEAIHRGNEQLVSDHQQLQGAKKLHADQFDTYYRVPIV
jgi:hypothetical protein